MGGFVVGLMLVIYVFVCVFLIFVILIQSGKGGGLSSLGGASEGLSEAFGATGAERTLNKMTTFCAVGFMVLAILLSISGSMVSTRGGKIIGPRPQASTPVGQTAPGMPGATVPGRQGAPGAARMPGGVIPPAKAKPGQIPPQTIPGAAPIGQTKSPAELPLRPGGAASNDKPINPPPVNMPVKSEAPAPAAPKP